MPIIAPSILAADFANLEKELKDIRTAPWVHIDVMDGHFVPNISFGMPVIKSLRPHSHSKFDVHLMIEPADPFLEATAKAGADHITVHIENNPHIYRTIQTIHSLGCKAGVAICPGTPANTLSEIMDIVDIILVMTVNPGFGGQKFLNNQLSKIRQIADMIEKTNPNIILGVDGGIDTITAPLVTKAGASMLVAGSAIFGQKERATAIQNLINAAHSK